MQPRERRLGEADGLAESGRRLHVPFVQPGGGEADPRPVAQGRFQEGALRPGITDQRGSNPIATAPVRSISTGFSSIWSLIACSSIPRKLPSSRSPLVSHTTSDERDSKQDLIPERLEVRPPGPRQLEDQSQDAVERDLQLPQQLGSSSRLASVAEPIVTRISRSPSASITACVLSPAAHRALGVPRELDQLIERELLLLAVLARDRDAGFSRGKRSARRASVRRSTGP